MFKRKVNFMETEEGRECREALILMATNGQYNTESSYSSNSERYPDNQIPFVDKHMRYLDAHPSLDPKQYIANLRIKTRLR